MTTIEIPKEYKEKINEFVKEYNNNVLPGGKHIKPTSVKSYTKDQYDTTGDWEKSFNNTKEFYIKERTPKKGTPITTIKPVIQEINVPEDSIKELKDPDLLLHIVEELGNRGIKGEEDTLLVLINKTMLRLVKNSTPTSGNIVVSDESGSGKDWIVNTVCEFLVPGDKLFHRTRISEKALDYWGSNKDEKWTWDGSVLYLEDPDDEAIKSQAFRVIASGKNKISVVIDKQLVDISVEGKPVIIVTSKNATIDDEGGRRWDGVRVDLSEKLTEMVIEQDLKKASGKNGSTINKPLQEGLQHLLKPYEVIIPYAEQIKKYLPKHLVMRTQDKKLLDYIRASAVLHQFQREKDDQGRVIANWFDYDYAVFMFEKLRDIEGKLLNKDEEEFINILRQHPEGVSIREMSNLYKRHSKQWIYDHLDDFKNKGLIRDSNLYEEKSNKEITYLRCILEYSSLNLPSSLVLNGFKEGFENQDMLGFKGFKGFIDKVNDRRKVLGLPLYYLHTPKKTLKTRKP